MQAHDFAMRLEPSASRSISPALAATTRGGIVVFSGGSAANNLVDVFNDIREANNTALSYVIPISDNGGSSSEIIRVFGGPGIGDVRSRLVRLIPDDGDEAKAIKSFFNYRLPKTYAQSRAEWLEIVEATHPLWLGISSPKKELIRSFLNSMNLEIVKRLRPTSRFDFSGAAIGNLFLTGARLFTGSFESAVYLVSSICGIPAAVSILPVLNTNFAHHIAAKLADGSVITGQNNISHPSAPAASVTHIPVSPTQLLQAETEEHDKVEDANMPGTHPELRKPAIAFSKEGEEKLPARIERLFYINPYGQEITIPANPRVLEAIKNSSCIIYSIGSLFTSLVPSLVLKGVGAAISSPMIRTKILILNGTLDRETGPPSNPFSAMDFVATIVHACTTSQARPHAQPHDYWQYVTHVIHLDGPTSPAVDKSAFNKIGIETMRVYGRPDENGKGGRYDVKALTQALEAVIGRKDPRGMSRRNTAIS